MPPGIARVGVAGEPDDEQPEVRPGQPVVGVEELMQRFQKGRHVGGLVQWRAGDVAAYHGLAPTRRVVEVHVELFRRESATRGREGAGQRRPQRHESALDELVDLPCAQHRRDPCSRRRGAP